MLNPTSRCDVDYTKHIYSDENPCFPVTKENELEHCLYDFQNMSFNENGFQNNVYG